jgi:MoaA/NifB/PqqE/SkfB family radical SAM enzyme
MTDVLHSDYQARPIRAYANPLPLGVCFRVTRFCNARCGFCLAPPDGGIHPSAGQLKEYIGWLIERGVRRIHFCGGEPTIHHALPELVEHVYAKGGKPLLTTNGISLSGKLMTVLNATDTKVKVSLHGPLAFHDSMVGREAFDATTNTIRRLIASGVRTSIQTTIVHEHLEVVDWMIRYGLQNKIKSISFLPFIPRGNGYKDRGIYELSYRERRRLRDLVKQKRRQFNTIIDLQLLDFNVKPVPVVEPDGRIILEGSMESKDVLLYRISI